MRGRENQEKEKEQEIYYEGRVGKLRDLEENIKPLTAQSNSLRTHETRKSNKDCEERNQYKD